MHEIAAAEREVKLLGEVARAQWGKPSYKYLKREWLDAVDRLNRLVEKYRERTEAARMSREENWKK
jgi:hypothetical protein